MNFHQYKLHGHREPILCLAHSSHSSSSHSSISSSILTSSPPPPCCLLSGSEDGTMRCWDLRSSKASLCILSPQKQQQQQNNNTVDTTAGTTEITSVAFYPSWGYSTSHETSAFDTLTTKDPSSDNSTTRFALPFIVYVFLFYYNIR